MPSVTIATPATASTPRHQAHRPQQGRVRVARAAEPPQQRRGKQRQHRAIQGDGRRPEDQAESKDAAHAGAQRPAGPVNPKMTWNAVTAAAASTNSAVARTAPGLSHRKACCKRPWRRSMATGTAMLAACSSSRTRSAIALASTTPRKGISIVANAIP